MDKETKIINQLQKMLDIPIDKVGLFREIMKGIFKDVDKFKLEFTKALFLLEWKKALKEFEQSEKEKK